MSEIDIVSDLNEGTADHVPATQGFVEPARVNAAPERRLETPEAPSSTEVPEENEPAKPLSLRDQISSALKGDPNTPPAAQHDGGQARNPDGTFAPAAAAQPAAPGNPIAVPAGLQGAEYDAFTKLPAEMQQLVARTMETANQQATQYASYQQVEQVLAPRRQGWAMNGMNEAQAINQLLALSDFAARDPMGFVRQFAHQRQLDLEELAFGPEPVDPTIAAQNQRIQELEQQLHGINTQRQTDAHNQIVQEVIAFGEEKDASGELLRPYLVELGDTFMPFIQMAMRDNPNAPRAQVLQAAYDRAVWAMPSVREKLQAKQAAEAEAARVRESQQAAARARKAGVSVPSGVPSDGAVNGALQNNSGNLREALKAAIAHHS